MNSLFDEYSLLVNETLALLAEEYTLGSEVLVLPEHLSFFSKESTYGSLKTELNHFHSPLSTPDVKKQKIEISNSEKLFSKSLKSEQAPQQKAQIQPAEVVFFSEELHKEIANIFPNIKISKQIPCDSKAQIIAESWKQPSPQAKILLFSFSHSKPSNIFFQNIKIATEAHFDSVAIIDMATWTEKNNWDSFFKIHTPGLIITSPEIYQYKDILKYYRENPVTQERFLGSSKLLLTKPLSEYLKYPENKKKLWNEICMNLSLPQ
ncbi:MAG: hypothetical protein EBZ47_02705 [Chlamydiae bacterium]|nr:hypothetical protein [Chlamydiota bacterium]